MTKVAVVTGSNKGIGFAIVRALCKQFDGDVFLTARSVERGEAAVAELKKEGLNPLFHPLDQDDKATHVKLRDFLKEKYGGLDLLINNAGMAYKKASTAPFAEQAEVTNRTNFFGLINVCDALFPILRSGARVVHVSSMVSHFALGYCSPDIQTAFKTAKSVEDVKKLIEQFVEAAKKGTHKEEGFANTSYGMSKLGVTAITPIQQDAMEADTSRTDIIVNCCCPGYVNTDMSSHKGPLTPDQGADTPVYLGLLPANAAAPRGQYLSERKVKPFRD